MKNISLLTASVLLAFFCVAHAEESEEASAQVGPDKGIVEVNERLGFKLSAEALKNFEIKSIKLTGNGPWEIPQAAIMTSGEEVNIFRARAGYFKRIDFEFVRNKDGKIPVLDSDEMRDGDEVVIVGVGFLRVAELSLSGGLAHSH